MRTISDYRFSKLQKLKLWYGHVTRSDGLTKVILQGTIEGSRRRGGLTTSRIGPENSSHCEPWHTTGRSRERERADEEVRHDVPLELLAELRDQGKAKILNRKSDSYIPLCNDCLVVPSGVECLTDT